MMLGLVPRSAPLSIKSRSKQLGFAAVSIHASSLQVSAPSDSVKPAEMIPMGIAITAIPQIAVKDAMIFPNAVTG